MLVEISQMQRLTVFLGHPSYGLAVLLFTLLLSSGVGSCATQAWRGRNPVRLRLGGLLVSLLAFGVLSPAVTASLIASTTPVRIGAAALLLAPLGFFMGMAFPTGMEVAQRQAPRLAPWLWGVNGALSVCASVAALVLALTVGISASYWTGAAFYLLAAAALIGEERRPRPNLA